MIDEHVARGNGLENHRLVFYLPQESHNRDLYSSCSDKRPKEASGRAGKPVYVQLLAGSPLKIRLGVPELSNRTCVPLDGL